MLLLANKTVQGHQYRLIYSERLFQIQRATPNERWVTVHTEQVRESAFYFWNHALIDRKTRLVAELLTKL